MQGCSALLLRLELCISRCTWSSWWLMCLLHCLLSLKDSQVLWIGWAPMGAL